MQVLANGLDSCKTLKKVSVELIDPVLYILHGFFYLHFSSKIIQCVSQRVNQNHLQLYYNKILIILKEFLTKTISNKYTAYICPVPKNYLQHEACR